MKREEMQAKVQRLVDAMPEPSQEPARGVAAILNSSQVPQALPPEPPATPAKAGPEVPAMLSREEVARRLGVSTRWLIRNAASGADYYKLPGGTIRYSETDIANWLRQRRVTD